MPITRKRQTFWVTSDDKPHDSGAAAREHEKRIQLIKVVQKSIDEGVAAVVADLLAAPNITIVLHEPREAKK